MLDLRTILANEFSQNTANIQNALDLFEDGATVPFIARYRKERTGGMNEIVLRDLLDRYVYLKELEERKASILESIAKQGKLDDELKQRIENCTQKTELEDLYLPYKPRKRTRATIARERGLEPLAGWLKTLNTPEGIDAPLLQEASRYVSIKKEVPTPEDALRGAADILAEEVAEKVDLRTFTRRFFAEKGEFVSEVRSEFEAGSTKFEMYRDFRAPVNGIAAHNMLALRRGENEGVLLMGLNFDEQGILDYLEHKEIHTNAPATRAFFQAMIKDAFERLMKNSLIGEVRYDKKLEADETSTRTFGDNLRELLLASPAGPKPTLGIDPGFRTGCKIAVLDETGQLIEHTAIFPHGSAYQKNEATSVVRSLIERHSITLVAIGNGTAGRETDAFMNEALKDLKPAPIKVMVSEAGASVYSASKVAITEFPELDVTVRGAISIARRLQDPLAELVKIDPKSIGVGQYQHDVDQRLLKKKLEEVVESCVNFVGVDLNTASAQLLEYVSGLSPVVARNIVEYRNKNGRFQSREELLQVSKLGAKTFEQAAGFLRIRDGSNPLDNTAVHPESYHIAKKIVTTVEVDIADLSQHGKLLKSLDLQQFVSDFVGLPTLQDIVAELEKPGRDPRAQFTYAQFKEGIKEIKDLKPDMELEGIVTNVTNFGAFVDIGVHQDGLVHISQMADRFVDNPTKVVKVGQVVRVKVLEVNEALKRISLSMRFGQPKAKAGAGRSRREEKRQVKPTSLEDLKNKFRKTS